VERRVSGFDCFHYHPSGLYRIALLVAIELFQPLTQSGQRFFVLKQRPVWMRQ